jgi:hypothetical protein
VPRNMHNPNDVSDTPLFAGSHYDPKQDEARLKSQMERVRIAMRDAGWLTLAQVARRAECGEASASAQMRNLRKIGHTILVERRPYAIEYKLVTPEQTPDEAA